MRSAGLWLIFVFAAAHSEGDREHQGSQHEDHAADRHEGLGGEPEEADEHEDERDSDGDAATHRRILWVGACGQSGRRGRLQDPVRIAGIAREIRDLRDRDVQVSIVVGGGNIFRGLTAAGSGMDRATGDYAGMLAM